MVIIERIREMENSLPEEFSKKVAEKEGLQIVLGLEAELQRYVEYVDGLGYCLRHPLVYAIPLFEGLPYNEILSKKRERLMRSIEKKDWNQVMFLYERPYRLQKLYKYFSGGMILPEELAEILDDVWIDAEKPPQSMRKDIVRMFRAAGFIGDEHPDRPLTIFRGVTDKRIRGLSWTEDLETAKWFARRYNRQGAVYRAMIDPVNVLARFSRRNEFEVVVNPVGLRNVRKLKMPVDLEVENEI